jgi:hypothetical protein
MWVTILQRLLLRLVSHRHPGHSLHLRHHYNLHIHVANSPKGVNRLCWGKGEDATLRSMPSPVSLHKRRQDDWQTPPFAQCAEERRLLARSPHPAVSSNTKAHVQSGPL